MHEQRKVRARPTIFDEGVCWRPRGGLDVNEPNLAKLHTSRECGTTG